MAEIPGFWDVGPHEPVPVEATWRQFVRQVGGSVLDDLLPSNRSFENADFWFESSRVTAELKEVETEFSSSKAFHDGFDRVMTRLVKEQPEWKPVLLGGTTPTPSWVNTELLRLFRPPLSRILKKANRQLRATKQHFGSPTPLGILLFANDGFASLSPEWVRALASDLLVHSYSSIDCFVYLTVNRYVEFPGDQTPRLLWVPSYNERAPDCLVAFVDDLGRQWFDFLEQRITFTKRIETPQSPTALSGTKSITLPGGE